MAKTETRGAPKGNQNRLGKFKEDAATSFLHIKCRPQDKAAWVKAANGKLSEFVVKSLNEASK